MKLLAALAFTLIGSSAFALEYKCTTQACSWSDGCTAYTHYLLIQGSKIKYWMELNDKDKVDYTDINNVKKSDIRVGTLQEKVLENGNYLATGKGLVAKGDLPVRNFLSRENEVYASLINGGKYGRMREITHLHREGNPNIELKPRVDEYKCERLN